MAASAKSGCPNIVISLFGHLAGIANAGQVRLVIKRAEVVGRVIPAVIRIFVAFEAVLVHHQSFFRDQLAGRQLDI